MYVFISPSSPSNSLSAARVFVELKSFTSSSFSLNSLILLSFVLCHLSDCDTRDTR